MNVYKFIDLLQERAAELDNDTEILVEGEDGYLHDFTLSDTEETFDGFYTAYPAGLKIVPQES